ncbi:MAG: amino acid kinase [Halobacteriota archaeon]
MRKRAIIKLGGSLIENGREIVEVLRVYAKEKEKDRHILVIPGGGPFVAEVRNYAYCLTEEAAHWMAILAMHQYGLFLANDELLTVESLDEIDESFCIILPYQILKADDSLPHTWDVTSDTIAAFIAMKLGERTFIKLTDVDGMLDEEGHLIERMRAEELIEAGRNGSCVDGALPAFLIQHKMCCIIINGNFTARVIDAMEGKATRSTKLF